jgi:hypothetical protein
VIYSNAQTKVASGEYTFGAGDSGYSIALDETTNMLYVGGSKNIYKLSAGDATQLPTLLDTLVIDSNVDGDNFNGMALDTANGYGKWKGLSIAGNLILLYTRPHTFRLGTQTGYAGSKTSVVMFSLGAGNGKSEVNRQRTKIYMGGDRLR